MMFIGENYLQGSNWKPTGNTEKKYIKEVSRILNSWTQDSLLRSIILKVIHIMRVLLLQKLCNTSKSRDHLDALKRRLQLWERGEIKFLLLEVETIQQKLISNNYPKNIGEVLKKFAKLMRKGNVNGTLKLLTNNVPNFIFLLDEDTPNSLKQKNPQLQPAYEEILINSKPPIIHHFIFDDINDELVRKAAIRIKGGSSLSELDNGEWRKMLSLKVFGRSIRPLLISLNILVSAKLSFRTRYC